MPMEHERKYLVLGDGWRAAIEETFVIRQGYLAATESCSVRIRHAGDRAFLTVKGAKASRSRPEYEYEVPTADAAEMLDTLASGAIIEKRRHRVRVGRHVWEVDEFQVPAGLVMAEIELDHCEEAFALPDWVGREVTDDPRYGNARMAAEGGVAPLAD